jgi:cytochrome b
MNNRILVWDIPTRLCHWLLACTISYSWYSIEILENVEQHFWSGYIALTLIVFRIIWGFVGTRHARFSSFFYNSAQIKAYTKTLLDKTSNSNSTSKRYFGHNPVGSLSAILMIMAILTQAITGLFNSDDYYFGPLSGLVGEDLRESLGEFHHLNFDFLIILIVIHILAILFYQFHKRENLTKAMVTGKKELNDRDAIIASDQRISGSKMGTALIVLAISIAAVYLLANAFSDTLSTSEFNFNY